MAWRNDVEILTQHLNVPFDYPVIFDADILNPANPALAAAVDRLREGRRHRLLAVSEAGLLRAWPDLGARLAAYVLRHADRLELVGDLEALPAGEASKQGWDGAFQVMRWIQARNLDRQSVVLALGGGGLLDTVGLAAALVHRGLRLVRVPTTVLAQNDVGVGVKNGIDLDGVKNLIGVFAPPFAVLVDHDFLATLPDREWRGGAAEAFKVALLKDAVFFDFLCREAGAVRRRDTEVMRHLVRRCAELHLEHIRTGGDPFEMGSARPLDFGHWSAHRLEVLSQHAVRHGEAVAIGIALDTTYAAQAGWVTPAVREALLRGLTECGLAIWHPLLETRGTDGGLAILDGLERFREHLGGRLTLTFPDGIGRRREEHAMDHAAITASAAYLRNWRTKK